jgi:hypothetical protein
MSNLKRFVVGIVVFTAIAGGLHAYGTYRVDRDVERVASTIDITHLAILQHAAPEQRTVRVHLEVRNPTGDAVTVSLTPVSIEADDYSIGSATWLGEDEALVEPGKEVRFEGQTTLWESTFEGLQAEDEVIYRLKGEITISDEFLWVNQTEQQPFELELRGMVD